MVAVCVEETRAVLLWHAVSEPYAWPESGTRVVVGWWDRPCAREGLGNYRYICGITSTYVVAEAYMRSTGSVGSDTWPHTHGEGCTRRARGRSEQRASDASKNIGVFCGYTLVSGLSRGYTRSGGGTRGSGVRMQRAVRRAQPSWWPEGLISIEGARPHRVFNRPA